MKFICTRCGLYTEDGNLWCQRLECSAANLTRIFKRGESLGDIEILNLLRAMRTASVYEAQRNGEPVLLKIAHHDSQENLQRDQGYAAHLKEEAKMFEHLQKKGIKHPSLPRLLPPYNTPTVGNMPYGRIVVEGKLRYYTVFEHVQGQFLRDLLNNKPQPQVEHAIWIALALADTLTLLERHLKILHKALSPDCIFIRTDDLGIPRPLLFDLGFHRMAPSSDVLRSASDAKYYNWLSQYVHPAYTAPELFENYQGVRETDTYGLGLLIYEMFSGKPAFEFQTRTEEMVRNDVKNGNRPPLPRVDLVGDVVTQVEESLNIVSDLRNGSVRRLGDHLSGYFPALPAEEPKNKKRNARIQQAALLVLLAILLALAAMGVATYI